MATWTLPNIVSGGSINVEAGSLAEAQQAAANQTGVSLAQQQAGGTFGANTNPSLGGGGGGGGGAGVGGNQQVNVDAQIALMNQANQAALIAYYNSKLALDSDELAFRKATQAFADTVTKAGLTGVFEGQPTFPAMQSYAQMFGSWGVPTAGQQTLAAQQQAFGQTIAAQQEARQQAALQQQTAQNYLDLLSRLRGPADLFQYQKVLGATPAGLQDLVRAAAGQYIPGGGATTGVQPTAANLQNFIAGATSGQGGMTAADQAALQALVPPNQLAPQTWRNLAPSQQQVLLAAWENQGYRPEDARALFEQSLPRYATSAPSTGTFRLV
jgi:hypothetical protein